MQNQKTSGKRVGAELLHIRMLGQCSNDALKEQNVAATGWNPQPQPARQFMLDQGDWRHAGCAPAELRRNGYMHINALLMYPHLKTA
jgi:hypothetical protein